MPRPLILASSSTIRRILLETAGLSPHSIPARIDEESVTTALLAAKARPNDIADTLAEMKARKVAEKHPTTLVLGCDQVLSLGESILSKPTSQAHAMTQLQQLQGRQHHLHAAIVLYDHARPIWRHVAVAKMTMWPMTEAAITSYVHANWHSIQDAVGCYKIEDPVGHALFSAIDGDITTIQGLPMDPLMQYLRQRGFAA